MLNKLNLPRRLNSIQKLLQLDIKYYAYGGFWGSLQQLIGILSGLVISYLFGHFVSKTVFGEFNLVVSLTSLLMFFSLPGIDQAVTPSVGRGHDSSLIYAVKSKLKFSLWGSLGLIIFAWYYFVNANLNIALTLLLTAVLFPALYSFSPYVYFLTAKRLFKQHALLTIVSSLIFLATSAISIFMFPFTIGISLGHFMGLVIPAALGLFVSLKFVKNLTPKDHDLAGYGKFLTGVSILPWVSGNLGNVILANKIGPEALAIYTVAISFLVDIQKNLVVFYKPITAKLAAQTPKQHLKTLKTHFGKFLLLGLGLALFLWVATPFLITFFYPSYKEAIFYGQLLSLALIPLPLAWVLNDTVIYQKLKKTQVFISVVPQLFKIALYFFLIPIWHIKAVVLIFLLERFTAPLILALALRFSQSPKE